MASDVWIRIRALVLGLSPDEQIALISECTRHQSAGKMSTPHDAACAEVSAAGLAAQAATISIEAWTQGIIDAFASFPGFAELARNEPNVLRDVRRMLGPDEVDRHGNKPS